MLGGCTQLRIERGAIPQWHVIEVADASLPTGSKLNKIHNILHYEASTIGVGSKV